MTYRQGLQPLFVELSLLTRHPEGRRGGKQGRGWGWKEKGETWDLMEDKRELGSLWEEVQGSGGEREKERRRKGGVSKKARSFLSSNPTGDRRQWEKELAPSGSKVLSFTGHVPPHSARRSLCLYHPLFLLHSPSLLPFVLSFPPSLSFLGMSHVWFNSWEEQLRERERGGEGRGGREEW